MKSIKIFFLALLHLVACSGTLEPFPGYSKNPNPLFNPDLMDNCEEICIEQLIDCLLDCENVECESQCRRTSINCNNGKQLLGTAWNCLLILFSMSMYVRLLRWM